MIPSNVDDLDARFMREALKQARKGMGRTSPNPAVGAVIVQQGRIVARGYHRKAGLPHAEVEALKKIGRRAPGATLYVTLEPCNHHGQTPPCTEAILESGISRVVVGIEDPNPAVTGGGCRFLASKGLRVHTGVLEQACRRHHEAFFKHATTGRPLVAVKSAMTLDGWTATATGDSKWVTGEKSRRFVHLLRDRMDAVMVGVGTVMADDPQLTTRLGGGKGRDPLRIVLDTHLKTPRRARILTQSSKAKTCLAVGMDVPDDRIRQYESGGITVLKCPLTDGRVDLGALLDRLGNRSVTSLLVEGGATVIGSMLRQCLVDKFYLFKAPKILGGGNGVPMAAGPGPQQMDGCLALKDMSVRRFGKDILVIGYPVDRSDTRDASS